MNSRLSITRIATIIFLLSCFVETKAIGAEIKLLSGSAITPVMRDLIPKFEQSSGDKVVADTDAAIGAMMDRVLKGEAADVVIVSGPQVEKLQAANKVVAGSRVDIAKVGVGVFVRSGSAKPDISTVEAFRRTMLAAKSIGWNDPAAGAPVSIYMLGVFERLGIADQTKAKTVAFKQRSERFAAVARGDVEIGFNKSARSWPRLGSNSSVRSPQRFSITRYSVPAS